MRGEGLCYKVEVLTAQPGRRRVERINPTNADRWGDGSEDEGSKTRREMWEWCSKETHDFRVDIIQSNSGPWLCTYRFAKKVDADAFRKQFGIEDMIDLDVVRVKRSIENWTGNGIEPDNATMEAAQRLKDRDPDSPLLAKLARLLNKRDCI